MSRFLVDLNFFFFNALQDTIPVYVPNRAQFFFFLTDFPHGSDSKECAHNAEDPGSIPG